MRVIRNSANWQIATNSKMYNVSTEKLRRECNRYNSIHKRLINEPDTLSWQQGMDALQSAEQVNKMYHLESGSMMVNTQWSAVFDLKARVVIVCMNREYDKVYRFKLYNKKYYQNNSN